MVETLIKESVMIETSHDAMEARAKFFPPENGGETLSFEEFIKVVNNNKFYGFLDSDRLKKLFNNRMKEMNPLILSGTPPVDGKDGVILFHFDVGAKCKIQSVSAGQILATVIPGDTGIDGVNVFGKRILARKGKMPTFPRGRNTEISDDKFLLYSKIDGRVEYVNSKVNVDKVYIVDGDLDENINFVGDVIVKGNVLSKRSIKTRGNVEVYGVVEGASIEASGNINIRKGIVGAKRCAVKCGSDITAKFIENATVYAKGNIVVDVILHGDVSAGGNVIVKGRKGQIIGGRVRVGGDVIAYSIGTPMHIPTYIEVGVDIAMLQQCVQLERKMQELKESALKYKRLKTMPVILKREINDLACEYRECKEKTYFDKNAKIIATKEMYSGTTIVIKGISKTIKRVSVNAMYILSGKDIVKQTYKS